MRHQIAYWNCELSIPSPFGANNRWLFGFSKFVSTTSSSLRQPIHEKCGIEFVLLVATIMHGMKSHGVNFGCKIVVSSPRVGIGRVDLNVRVARRVNVVVNVSHEATTIP